MTGSVSLLLLQSINFACKKPGVQEPLEIGSQMEKFVLFVVLYFIVVQFVFPRLGIKPG